MATVEQLAHQVASIRAKVGRPGDPKHWIFCMAADMEIPECIASQMGPYDTVVVHEVMSGYLGEDEPDSCTVISTHGNFLVDMQEGRWTAVKQSAASARRR